MSGKTYVIMPVYNEASVAADVIRSVAGCFKNIICVNDGSSDDTSNVIKMTKAVLVEHPFNLGAGAATQTGIEYALLDKKAKYFITIDGDGQHDIKDAVKMLDYLKSNNLDIVIGSRFLGSSYNMNFPKRLLLNIAKVFSKMDSGIALTDPHIGLRVFNRNFAEHLKITMPDFAHASEVVRRIKEGNYKWGEVPVTVTYSDYSKAKGQPMLNAINISFDLVLQRIYKK